MTSFRVTEELKAEVREHLQRVGERPDQTAERRVREELTRLGFEEPWARCAKIRKVRGEDAYRGAAMWSWKFRGHAWHTDMIAEEAPTCDEVVDAIVARVWLLACAALRERAGAETGAEAVALREELTRLIALRPPRTPEGPTPAGGASP